MLLIIQREVQPEPGPRLDALQAAASGNLTRIETTLVDATARVLFLWRLRSMKIQIRPLDQIKPYPGNPRRHNAAGIKATANSISRFGWQQPIVTDPEGVIIVGHARFEAAQSLGLETASGSHSRRPHPG